MIIGKGGVNMYKVYGDYRSGNCYKIKLMLTLLGKPFECAHRYFQG